MKAKESDLKPETKTLIGKIKNDEVRSLLLKGLHPHEVVDGWYATLARAILQAERKALDSPSKME